MGVRSGIVGAQWRDERQSRSVIWGRRGFELVDEPPLESRIQSRAGSRAERISLHDPPTKQIIAFPSLSSTLKKNPCRDTEVTKVDTSNISSFPEMRELHPPLFKTTNTVLEIGPLCDVTKGTILARRIGDWFVCSRGKNKGVEMSCCVCLQVMKCIVEALADVLSRPHPLPVSQECLVTLKTGKTQEEHLLLLINTQPL